MALESRGQLSLHSEAQASHSHLSDTLSKTKRAGYSIYKSIENSNLARDEFNPGSAHRKVDISVPRNKWNDSLCLQTGTLSTVNTVTPSELIQRSDKISSKPNF